MKQFLFVLTVAGAIACISTPASASLPSSDVLPLDLQTTSNLSATDTMLAQCYGGGYSYAPVRTYYRAAPAVSVRVGGGRYYGRGYGGYGGNLYRSGFRGYGGGFGGGFGPGGFGPGFNRGFGRSGVGLFLSF